MAFAAEGRIGTRCCCCCCGGGGISTAAALLRLLLRFAVVCLPRASSAFLGHRCPRSADAPPFPPLPCTAGGWERHLLHDFGAAVWRVSWSVSGNILSVSDANNAVTLWKEAADGQWQQITQ